ncbi:bifunctional diaminohydroxyphosphoribosylaminopyrimidine deaminase/5-amino-6-(5-phosphoribosylamino)uracil reductase RibD [Paludisphaera rhizosphaerae]|uniref:bifunctional diaminohydroxyphosphoribosylaminopyrimidine deaminase/5-amino-6-(5-phosphoribosylamino)uracil reductase RibD n=1 Tax=Paludisphaera rhizosphaerae TaxID=2711216 RepID=UPI001F0F5686|nr:bifunctional diaminohydroxyphosphoribosylaminopyrimidine deaminase/5-amino-6-(5-phosphoribosylamino)uracil reductase RibD [Paludisphaera rhizosphaerae]
MQADLETGDPDMLWMTRAVREAVRGRGAVEPNPMVGAAVVRDGQLVSVGHHRRFGGPHAEVDALEEAGAAARGATLYVTLEPCCHQGKTPPCTDAILRAGIARVVAAHRDPFPKVAGGGFARLRDAGIEVRVGVGQEQAIDLNRPYLKRVVTGLPYVIAKWAMTLDGKTAVAGGDSRWISSAESRALVHKVRGCMDAILIGVGTAITDDPQLTVRPPGPRTPTRIVLDSHCRLPVDSVLVRTARETPTLVVTGASADVEAIDRLRGLGCEVLSFPNVERPPVGELLAELGSRGMTNVLVEGGGTVMGAFFEAGAVDEVDVFIAPLIEGGDHPRTAVRGVGRTLMEQAMRLNNVRRTITTPDVRIQGETHAVWRDEVQRILGSPPEGEAKPA